MIGPARNQQSVELESGIKDTILPCLDFAIYFQQILQHEMYIVSATLSLEFLFRLSFPQLLAYYQFGVPWLPV